MAEVTDTALNAQFEEIRDNTNKAGNTKLKVFNAFKNLFDTVVAKIAGCLPINSDIHILRKADGTEKIKMGANNLAMKIGGGTETALTPKDTDIKGIKSTWISGEQCYFMVNMFAYTQADAAQTNNVQGVEGYTVAKHPDGVMASVYGIIGNVEVAGAGTLTQAYPVRSGGVITGSGTTTHWKCFDANFGGHSAGGTGAITNMYGIYINAIPGASRASITNLYGIYQADITAKNYFAGNVLTDSDIELTDATKGIILKDSGDGSRRRVTVVNGVLTVSAPLT